MKEKNPILYANDNTEPISLLLKIRFPSLLLGLGLGILISFLTSRFEEVLSRNIKVAFFLPFIVYMADAIGSQTQSIYSRDLKTGKARFHRYLIKETFIGLLLGIVFGFMSGFIVQWWFSDHLLALSVGLSMFTTVAFAPLVALLITQAAQFFHEDPAAASGPITTVIQDMLSVVIYGVISSMIFL